MTIVSSNRWAKSSEDGTHRLLRCSLLSPPSPQKPQQHHARCGAGKRIIHNNSIRGTNSAIKTSIDGLYLRHGTEFSVL
ncbi:hypothetical protein Peur_064041 [Populus x canadensis]